MPAEIIMPLNGNRKRIKWDLNDIFNDTVAAGAVNGTLATPSGQTRTVTDTNSKISVGSGSLSVATGTTTADKVVYPSMPRTVGKTIIAKITTTTNPSVRVGSSVFTDDILIALTLTPVGGSVSTLAGDAPLGTYIVAMIARAAGYLYFVKGGAFASWTKIYNHKAGTGAMVPQYNIKGATNVISSDFIRVPTNPIVITPLASDAFTRADGALGTTGGGGSEETGGDGKTWITQSGTWGISTNKAVASVAGIATVDSGTINAIVECAITRSAGNVGIVLRYVDANNYVYAYHDGTNAALIKVVAGTPTTLVNAAATYGAGKRLIVTANLTKFRLFYGDTLIGAEQTIADAGLQTGTTHGMYTSDASNSLDNFVVWARGTGGEYESLLNKYAV